MVKEDLVAAVSVLIEGPVAGVGVTSACAGRRGGAGSRSMNRVIKSENSDRYVYSKLVNLNPYKKLGGCFYERDNRGYTRGSIADPGCRAANTCMSTSNPSGSQRQALVKGRSAPASLVSA